jgi:glycine hydroxymethyltransferase
MEALKTTDSEVYDLIRKELEREEYSLILIASENYVDEAILEVQGSILTNKYAEGYPDRRYYGGCQFLDRIERLAIERACKLFTAEHANVQPHSGSSANMAVMYAALDVGDKVLGMGLAHGGHLTHGAPVNYSGRLYKAVTYGVSKETGRIDFDEVREVARKEKPKMIIAGASAYSRIIDFERFRTISFCRYGSHRRCGCCGITPKPGAARPFCDHDNAQDAAGTEGRPDLMQEGVCEGNRPGCISGYPGWPLDACRCS